MKSTSFFTDTLLDWHKSNHRDMPWKNTDNPYYIWLSEIILQQTRVSQGLPYYEKFVKRYPTVEDLANAGEESILSDWQGLGYNSRARNLHSAAKHISENLEGRFPDKYEDILALKGVGPYSAAAISSFAFGLSYPVVDGNVKRFIARYLGIQKSIDDRQTHQEIEQQAERLISGVDPAEFNQAIMNFGALVCTPGKPNCTGCPFRAECFAFANDQTQILPIRTPKKPRRKRVFHYFAISCEDKLIMRRRTSKDIWQNMYDFPGLEKVTTKAITKKTQSEFLQEMGLKRTTGVAAQTLKLSQTLTHQQITAFFYRYQSEEIPQLANGDLVAVSIEKIGSFALPKIIDSFLKETYFK